MKTITWYMAYGIVGLSAALGCSSSSEDGEAGARTDSLVDTCQGSLECSSGGQSISADLNARDGACYLEAARINSDGTITSADGKTTLTWTGTIFKANICSPDVCVDCVNTAPPSVPGYECRGGPTACENLGAGACATQDGCSFSIGSTLGTSDDTCSGTPTACSRMKQFADCDWQRGCRWDKE
jgi:hypothetical protein